MTGITSFKCTVSVLNFKDPFIKSIILNIKVLFIKSDSNAVQEAKGLVRATDIVHYHAATYHTILTHQPPSVALQDMRKMEAIQSTHPSTPCVFLSKTVQIKL